VANGAVAASSALDALIPIHSPQWNDFDQARLRSPASLAADGSMSQHSNDPGLSGQPAFLAAQMF